MLLTIDSLSPAALAVNFGGKFLSQSDPHRITLLVQYLFYGIVVWITFRAELTSELSIQIKKTPFHDLQAGTGQFVHALVWIFCYCFYLFAHALGQLGGSIAELPNSSKTADEAVIEVNIICNL